MDHQLTGREPRPVRIGNCSGFYGDRLSAMREMLTGGPLDVLGGDYLAELTMGILARSRLRDPTRGYATSFLRQLEDCLGTAVTAGVRLVSNAGGLNPAGCADAVRALADRLGLPVRVAHVEGDDLLPQLAELAGQGVSLRHADTGQSPPGAPLTANVYLGGWGIARALASDADVVVTGRVTDAALVCGPAAWWHGWGEQDWDALAGAVVAGHLLECGAQVTGGNYPFFSEVPGVEHVGFPLAEVHADGTAVVTKHPATGGSVSVGTVTAQLLYEIGGPRYLGPDVTARFDTVRLVQEGPDRVRVSGVRGEPPPVTLKLGLTLFGGYRNSMTFLLTGLQVAEKAALVSRQLADVLAGVRDVDVRLARTDRPDPPTNEQACARLQVTVRDDDPQPVGRRFSDAAVALALASYPGATLTAPPGDAQPYPVFWPSAVPVSVVREQVVLADGSRLDVAQVPVRMKGPSGDPTAVTAGPPTVTDGALVAPGERRRAPLGMVFGARSGDKAGDANVGVWARDQAGYRWLRDELTVSLLRELLPEVGGLDVRRHLLPNLSAVNFVIRGLLGDGAGGSARPDPQAKGLAEWLRAREVALPVALLPGDGARPDRPPRPE